MHRQNRPRDSLIALFLLGAFLFLPPFFLIFDRPVRLLGIPLLYLYLFLAWALLIALSAMAVRLIRWEGHDIGANGAEHRQTPEKAAGDA
jgi:hypothetical protein